jgi:hypothetical protein
LPRAVSAMDSTGPSARRLFCRTDRRSCVTPVTARGMISTGLGAGKPLIVDCTEAAHGLPAGAVSPDPVVCRRDAGAVRVFRRGRLRRGGGHDSATATPRQHHRSTRSER